MRRWPPAWATTLLLVLAVCLWGTHYKLSLYNPQAAHQGPAAKLLSQKERPVASTQLASLAPNLGPGKLFAPQSHRILAGSLAALLSGAVLKTMPGLRTLHGLQQDSHRLPFRSLRQSTPRAPPPDC
jgi:hypothetical protein